MPHWSFCFHGILHLAEPSMLLMQPCSQSLGQQAGWATSGSVDLWKIWVLPCSIQQWEGTVGIVGFTRSRQSASVFLSSFDLTLCLLFLSAVRLDESCLLLLLLPPPPPSPPSVEPSPTLALLFLPMLGRTYGSVPPASAKTAAFPGQYR